MRTKVWHFVINKQNSSKVAFLPASGRVCSALEGSRRGWPMFKSRGHGGGGVSLGNGDLLGLAGLFSAVRTEALTFQH